MKYGTAGICIGMGALALLLACPARAVTLAEPGAPPAVLVTDASATAPERMAAQELSTYLGKVTGSVFPIVSQSGTAAGTRIYVGPSDYTEQQGLDPAQLGPEEWVIRTVDGNLILTGGRPRGTLYAVYHFLEDVVGVHWWNPYEEQVPAKPALSVDALDLHGQPVFRYRDIYSMYGNDGGRFAARNRLNRDGDTPILPEYGGSRSYGPPAHCHTFYRYFPPDTYFAAHPEWFSLIDGKRDANEKQLCLTNPELRAAFLEKLKAYIATSRADAERAGLPAPAVFSVTQNDCGGMCQCPACHAIAEAEESESGPLLDFVNYLADAIREAYPGVYIDTLAYSMTQKPPKSIKPRDNVIIRLCDTSSNFTKPITDPENTPFRDCLTSWSGIAKNLRIWDYAVTYPPHYGLPMPSVHTYPIDYQFYAGHHVEGVLTEHEYPILADLRDFKIWMMLKLLEDPGRDYATLVHQFLDGFYGPAGSAIHAYLEGLESAAAAKPSYLSMGASPLQYKYLDVEFLRAASGLFDQAEQTVAGDDVLLRRVRHARLPLDRAIVVLYAHLKKEWAETGHAPETFPLDGPTVAERCKASWYAQIELRIPEAEREAERGAATLELKGLARSMDTPLPEPFRGMASGRVIQFTPYETRNATDLPRRVQDPACENGAANRLEFSGEDMKRYAMPLRWGLYDSFNQRGTASGLLPAEAVPGPGYHWYKLGTAPITPSCYLYFFWSWIVQMDIEGAIDSDHPDQPFEIWANIQFEGPGFPHGRPDEKNAISIGRVVLVKTPPQ